MKTISLYEKMRTVIPGSVYTSSEDQPVILCTVNITCSIYNFECKPISLYKLNGKYAYITYMIEAIAL
jgi:hypothetical protein